MHYTDQQLGIFIEQLQHKGILEHSIVAIYGDHFGLQPKDNDPAWVSEQLGIPYHEIITRMNVPFIVAVPDVPGDTIDQVGGQLDMLPTILNLLGISEEQSELILFGSDMLNVETNTIGARYYLPTGSFFNDEVLFIPGTGFNDGTAISLDTYQKMDLNEQLRADYNYVLQLMSMSDLYTSSYPKRQKF
jgi:lipoteichoic acid synthase